jgi:diacylglycerol kinase family enzyme
LIDVCIVKKPPVRAIPWIAHLMIKRKIEKSKYMEIRQASEILVKRKKGKMVNIDGEPVKLKKELKIEIRPASLNVVVP